jgi:integrase
LSACSGLASTPFSEVAGKVEIGPTKTRGSRRTIPLPREPALARILQAQIENAEDRWNYLGLWESDKGKPLLFTTLKGHPHSRTRFRARRWVPAIELAGITPPPNFHDLRHSYAAWLIQDGAHAKTLQDRLGHASSRTSLDLYGHLMRSTDDAQIDSMSQALGRDSRGTLVARPQEPERSGSS